MPGTIFLESAQDSLFMPNDRILFSLLPMDNLLAALFADDYGDESPNLSNAYQSSSISQTQMLEAGKSYLWAQRLSGLDFGSMTKTTPRSFVNSDYVEQVVRAIKNRISNRIQLNKILSCLGKFGLLLVCCHSPNSAYCHGAVVMFLLVEIAAQ